MFIDLHFHYKICRKREVVEEVDDDIAKEISTAAEGISSNSKGTVDRSGRPSAEAAERSTGPVDRRRRTVDRPIDRLKVPNSRLGTVDRQSGRAVSGKLLNGKSA